MNRLARGYSFEALRATILFTEGLSRSGRPKFERNKKADVLPYMAYVAGGHAMGVPTFDEPDDVNLGVDISTLTTWIEEGRL